MKKLIALLLLVSVLASADPGEATRAFMSRPASLFDMGMLKLNLHVDQKAEQFLSTSYAEKVAGYGDFRVWGKAAYRPESDRITVTVQLLSYTQGVETGRRLCDEALWWMRGQTRSPFSQFFLGIRGNPNPENPISNSDVRSLENSTMVLCAATTKDGIVWGRGFLMEDEIEYGEGRPPYYE